MKPLEGPISPGGEPEPSEAEFRADWARLRQVLEPHHGKDAPEPEFDEADPLAALNRAELLEKFTHRHRRRAERMGLPVQEFLDQAATLRTGFLKALAEKDQKLEALLRAQANLADLTPAATELLLEMEAELKAKWPTLSEAAREHWAEVLQDCAENRELWLSDLPIEDRRRLEAKYPKT